MEVTGREERKGGMKKADDEGREGRVREAKYSDARRGEGGREQNTSNNTKVKK